MKKHFIAILLLFTLVSPLYAFQDEDTVAQPINRFISGDTITSDETYTSEINEPVYTNKTFDPKFKNRYNDDDFDYSEKKESETGIGGFLKKIRDFISSIFNSTSNEQPVERDYSTLLLILKWFLRLLLVAAVIVIIITIIRGDISWLFSRNAKNVSREGFAEENILETNFAQLIEQTEATNDYKLATRYYYLWLLQKLSARGMITWNIEKTNNDYYNEIYDTRIKDDFRYLSYLYDYIWYGDFPLNDYGYLKARSAFNKTIKTL